MHFQRREQITFFVTKEEQFPKFPSTTKALLPAFYPEIPFPQFMGPKRQISFKAKAEAFPHQTPKT